MRYLTQVVCVINEQKKNTQIQNEHIKKLMTSSFYEIQNTMQKKNLTNKNCVKIFK